MDIFSEMENCCAEHHNQRKCLPIMNSGSKSQENTALLGQERWLGGLRALAAPAEDLGLVLKPTQ